MLNTIMMMAFSKNARASAITSLTGVMMASFHGVWLLPTAMSCQVINTPPSAADRLPE
jgi:hypothetical protein